jgi:hypothetical protein
VSFFHNLYHRSQEPLYWTKTMILATSIRNHFEHSMPAETFFVVPSIYSNRMMLPVVFALEMSRKIHSYFSDVSNSFY